MLGPLLLLEGDCRRKGAERSGLTRAIAMAGVGPILGAALAWMAAVVVGGANIYFSREYIIRYLGLAAIASCLPCWEVCQRWKSVTYHYYHIEEAAPPPWSRPSPSPWGWEIIRIWALWIVASGLGWMLAALLSDRFAGELYRRQLLASFVSVIPFALIQWRALGTLQPNPWRWIPLTIGGGIFWALIRFLTGLKYGLVAFSFFGAATVLITGAAVWGGCQGAALGRGLKPALAWMAITIATFSTTSLYEWNQLRLGYQANGYLNREPMLETPALLGILIYGVGTGAILAFTQKRPESSSAPPPL